MENERYCWKKIGSLGEVKTREGVARLLDREAPTSQNSQIGELAVLALETAPFDSLKEFMIFGIQPHPVNEECCICLDVYSASNSAREPVAIIKTCSHVFRLHCLLKSVSCLRPACPLCQVTLFYRAPNLAIDPSAYVRPTPSFPCRLLGCDELFNTNAKVDHHYRFEHEHCKRCDTAFMQADLVEH
jgi:hypothetical protein